MPLYEYECQACHRRTEKIQKFSDAELTLCPHCGGHLERTITAPAFQFSGGGWFADGYGSKKAEAPGGDAASAAPDISSASAATPAPAPASAPAAPASPTPATSAKP